jgi:heme exporter protein D
MKTNMIKTLAALFVAGAASAFAATSGSAGEGSGPFIWVFLGFTVLVVMLQAIPALILFVSMLRGLFSPSAKEATLPKA